MFYYLNIFKMGINIVFQEKLSRAEDGEYSSSGMCLVWDTASCVRGN